MLPGNPVAATDPANEHRPVTNDMDATAAPIQVGAPLALAAAAPALADREAVFDVRGAGVWYGRHLALRDVSMRIPGNAVTALIGPSGCGKSSFLRCLNRMHDLTDSAGVFGQFLFGGLDMYAPGVDPVAVRRRIGMVFQQPNPFWKSVYDNVAFGPRVLGMKQELDQRVEAGLRRAALWEELKDRLRTPATSLSGGQQQRLCIARALATDPEVLLMDEPCSALDPVATAQIEELMTALKKHYTMVVVTHNMHQAARVADMTAFFTVEAGEEGRRTGVLVEYDETDRMFTHPSDPRTEAYITGRFG
jgi:phosphate transport system ATP-binding protein